MSFTTNEFTFPTGLEHINWGKSHLGFTVGSTGIDLTHAQADDAVRQMLGHERDKKDIENLSNAELKALGYLTLEEMAFEDYMDEKKRLRKERKEAHRKERREASIRIKP